jgi:predicted protein tyrosine phosphatase
LGDWAVISITEQGFYTANLQRGWNNILRLKFHDVDEPTEPWVDFAKEDTRKIIEFVAHVHGGDAEGIMAHYKAGISRSAAVEKYIAEKHIFPFNHSFAEYNKLVYRILIEADAGSFL